MKKIILIIGTRPEAIKLIPVYLALKAKGLFDVVIVSTGQHKDMLTQIFSFFEIHPEVELNLMTPNQTLSQITASLLSSLENVVNYLKPDLVIVQGDTTTAMVAALVSFYNRIKIAHVEAGLRSFNKHAPYPEEANRRIISQLADVHFPPTKQSYDNLAKESITNIYAVGNTVIDSLLLAKKKIDLNTAGYREKFSPRIDFTKKIILITAHRRESFGDGIKNICEAIQTLAHQYKDLEFVFPVHLNPNSREPVTKILGGIMNVHLFPPLQYDDMIFLMSMSYLILTDSGGIQEEAPSLQVPLVVLRDVTERPEGIESGCAVLAGTSAEKILQVFSKLYEDRTQYESMRNNPNPYGDGKASERIVDTLCTIL